MEEMCVKPTKAKLNSIKGILYLDFKTLLFQPQPVDKGYPEDKSFGPMDMAYKCSLFF